MSYITTLHDLIKDLERDSSVISSMALGSKLSDFSLEHDLSAFANQDKEKVLVQTALERLVTLQLLNISDAEDITRRLLQETSFYGAFFELGTCGWMLRHGLWFQPQVRFNPPEILNPNSCTVDGVLVAFDTAFDIKAFGLAAYLVDLLKRKLTARIPGLRVTINGGMDVDVKTVEKDALGQLARIEAELRNNRVVTIPSLGWTITPIQGRPPLVTNVRTSGPYKQAEELRYHPFNHAAQFTTQKPFMLIFSYLYRFNTFLHDDSSGLTEKFFRSLARRAFIQLSSDTHPGSQYDSKMPNGVTVGDASALLSAILFVDLGIERYHVFFNPRAKHPIPQGIESFMMNIQHPNALASYDDFAHDNY